MSRQSGTYLYDKYSINIKLGSFCKRPIIPKCRRVSDNYYINSNTRIRPSAAFEKPAATACYIWRILEV